MPAELASTVEIACDESGSEGEKLVGGNTAVFAHASVRIDADAADACVAELRRRIRSPAVEYKANHLLRQKHRATLVWFLGPSGPIHGRAHVYLVEKAYFLVRSLAHRIQPRHAKNRLSTDYAIAPTMDPLLPALVRAIEHWSTDSRSVSITHDEHSTITEALIVQLKRTWPALTHVRLVDSMADARVQVADFLAGVARRVAEDALTGEADAELATLLRPYVDPESVWGDSSSWTALKPRDHAE